MTTRYVTLLMAGLSFAGSSLAAAEDGRGAFSTRQAFDAMMDAQGTRCLDVADDGSYAWGESYVMMSLVTMYEATGDTAYLDRLIDHADVVLANRDSVRNRTDYLGRALPAWSAGGHYSIGEIELADASGTPVLYLRSAITGYNNETEVTVTAGNTADTFTLNIVNERYRRSDLFENISMDPQADRPAIDTIEASPLARPFSYMRLHARDLRTGAVNEHNPPAPVKTTMKASRMVWPVHQGMILEPMTRFARRVYETPALKANPHYKTKADQFVQAADAAFAAIETEWRQNDEGEGWYEFPKGAPVWMDGCDEPHNHCLAVAAAMHHLAVVTHSPKWRDHVTRMAQTIRNDMRRFAEEGALTWPYWWSKGRVYNGWSPEDNVSRHTPGKRPTQSMEDFSHASIDVGFAVTCFKDGLVFTRDDMLGLARTFMTNIVRRKEDGRLTFAARVDGSGEPGRYDRLGPNWVLLAEFDPRVFDCFQEIRADSPWSGYALWMLMSANMNLMRQQDTP